MKIEFDFKIADDDEFTVEELTNKIGVGKWQVLAVCSIILGLLAENVAIQSQPFLSTRLYVEMDLTPETEGGLRTFSRQEHLRTETYRQFLLIE